MRLRLGSAATIVATISPGAIFGSSFKRTQGPAWKLRSQCGGPDRKGGRYLPPHTFSVAARARSALGHFRPGRCGQQMRLSPLMPRKRTCCLRQLKNKSNPVDQLEGPGSRPRHNPPNSERNSACGSRGLYPNKPPPGNGLSAIWTCARRRETLLSFDTRRKEHVMRLFQKRIGQLCATIAVAAVFWFTPVSLNRSASGITVSVDQAQAYTYGRHRRIYRRAYRYERRVYRRAYRRGYYYRY